MSQNRLLLIAFVLLGVMGALVLAALGGGFGGVAATSSPGASQVAVGSATPGTSLGASPGLTLAPATEAPSAGPTAPPTTSPTASPTKTPKPSPTPNTNPRIVSWVVPKYEDCTNDTAGTITVSWEVRRASGVTISIDGGGIFDTYFALSDTITIPFGCDQTDLSDTYTLRTVGGTGPVASLTRTVTARPASITSFDVGPGGVAECQTTNGVVGIDLDFVIRAATGAELYRDGELYSTYSTKEVHTSGIIFDCTKSFMTFRLTTTGGYGGNVSQQITVERQLP